MRHEYNHYEGVTCSLCGSDKTAIRTDGFHKGYPRWRRHPETNEYICDSCGRKLRALREYQYKDKRITTKEVQRTGHCTLCSRNIFDGSASRTAMHHLRYDDKNPDAHRVELCNVCHAKEHVDLRIAKFDPFCYSCGASETDEGWQYNHGTKFKLCKRCYQRIFMKESNRIRNRRYYWRKKAWIMGVRS